MIYMVSPIKEKKGKGGGEPLVGGLAQGYCPWSPLHLLGSISFHCHPLIVSTASVGIMYIGRMLLLVGQL